MLWQKESLIEVVLPLPAATFRMAGIIGFSGALTELKKKQRDPRDKHLVSQDDIVKAVRRGLPSPPPGLSWERKDSGDWVLIEHEEAESFEDVELDVPPPPPPAARREHVVLPGDTLQGVCLKYKTKPRLLKACNPTLDVRDPTLRGVTTLTIPGDGPCQPSSPEVDVARFRAATGLGAKEARYYLADGADLADAITRAKDDARWERGAASRTKKEPATKQHSAPVAARGSPREKPTAVVLSSPCEKPTAVAVAEARRVELTPVARAIPFAESTDADEPVMADIAPPTARETAWSFFFDF